MNNTTTSEVCIVDDHVLLRNGLASLMKNFTEYSVLFEADNGKDFIAGVKEGKIPDIVLLDINMPVMDGFETSLWLKENYPDVKILALSMYDDDNAIIRMLQNGAKGYILKDSEALELKNALDSVRNKGFYYSEMVTGKLIHAVNKAGDSGKGGVVAVVSLNERETGFLKLVCTELTYREIAEKMLLSPRTIDGYRDALFEKLAVKTRVGLAVYAIKQGIFRP
jgi:two-component system invasion response regulator UvrY